MRIFSTYFYDISIFKTIKSYFVFYTFFTSILIFPAATIIFQYNPNFWKFRILTQMLLSNSGITSPRPAPRHAVTSSSLVVKIGGPFQFGNGGPGGWWIIYEPELHFKNPTQKKEKYNVIVPDLAGWKKDRLPKLPETSYFELPPDWVCEVLSPSTARYDRISKMRIYAANGIPYYWVIDPIARTLEIFAFQDQNYRMEIGFTENDKALAPPFDAIELDLGALWDYDEA